MCLNLPRKRSFFIMSRISLAHLAARSFATLMVLALLAVPVFGQTSQGSISGTVRDPQDAAVVNANVTALEMDKKTSFTTTSDQAGRFTFTNLLPGSYMITVTATGFKKAEKEVGLLANDRLTVGVITLSVGAVTETVEVSAQTVA